jgi:hypothetical protein
MEGDLIIAAVGLVIIAMGGLIAVAGVHYRVQSIHDNAPAPVAGNIIAAVGALMFLLGLVLAATNMVIWMPGRHRGNQSRPKSENEALLPSIRDDGRRDRPA